MENKNTKRMFVFERSNYIILLIGLAINILGFILMIGGAASSPDEFNKEEIFSFRRITLAPIVILLGYVVVFYSIMKQPKKNKPQS